MNFKKFLKKARGLVRNPLASLALSVIPGGGLVKTAINAASSFGNGRAMRMLEAQSCPMAQQNQVGPAIQELDVMPYGQRLENLSSLFGQYARNGALSMLQGRSMVYTPNGSKLQY